MMFFSICGFTCIGEGWFGDVCVGLFYGLGGKWFVLLDFEGLGGIVLEIVVFGFRVGRIVRVGKIG